MQGIHSECTQIKQLMEKFKVKINIISENVSKGYTFHEYLENEFVLNIEGLLFEKL